MPIIINEFEIQLEPPAPPPPAPAAEPAAETTPTPGPEEIARVLERHRARLERVRAT